ncbi:integrase arm-type DNA-binding domain-containing protein [Hyphomonas sp.]|uniref:tyrosine-type recombinase/integrase n=1 Tax=Hyphomonas sp. TaxID=87 RepID=UPI0030FCD089
MALTDLQIRNLRPGERTAKVSDGEGLYLHMPPNGSKLWRMAYRFDGKQKTLSFGAYPSTSLSLARQRRTEAKRTLAEGQDPSRQARIAKQQRRVAANNTFNAVADEFLQKLEKEGRAPGTLEKKRWFIGMAKSAFGTQPIAEITAADILAPLRKVESKGHYETARRLRSTIGQVFRYAIATARTQYDPTYGLRGALISPSVTHRAAIIDRDGFAKLVKDVWVYNGTVPTATALRLMVLLYPRPGELRWARWREFDLEAGCWTIPAERMKMRKGHKKPLPQLAVDILKASNEYRVDDDFIFPAATTPSKPMSENTLNQALRRMKYRKDQATSHGFRASASSLLNESGLWSADAIEAELAHVSSNEVRRAYHRAQYWDERVKMSEWWAALVAGALNE